MKTVVLEQRRCIILGLVAATPSTYPCLDRLLDSGYLDYVKTWLEDILSGTGELEGWFVVQLLLFLCIL